MAKGSLSPETGNNGPNFQAIIPGKTCFVSFTNTAGDSPIFEENTTIIELFPTQDCWVLIQESTESLSAAIPSAGVKTDSKFLPGGIIAFLGLPIDRSAQYKLSVIRNTVSGNLYITEGKGA